VASVLVGVELNCIALGEMDTYWWGVHLSRIAHKEDELMVGVKWQDLSSFVCPEL
jgi:hypothetical protein